MRFGFNKIIFCFLSLFLLLNLPSDAFGQRKAKSKSETKITVEQKTDEERRKNVESFMLQGKYQHDGSGELMYIGTIESMPALLKVLEDHPPNIYQPCGEKIGVKIAPPPPLKNNSLASSPQQNEVPKPDCSPKKIYICTYAHAISALRKITGQNFVDYQDWKNWWENYQKDKEQTK